MKLNLEQFEGHTPGPWRDTHNMGANMQSYSQPSAVIGTGENSLKIICGCFGDIGGVKLAEANARLIAAAPALLAECKAQREQIAELVEALQSAIAALEFNGLQADQYAQVSRCRAALAKVQS